MENKIKIAGISGSLRKESFNTKALRYAASHAPKNIEMEIVEIGNLPFFNEDIEDNPPKEVVEFRKKIEAADAILFATPEYNYSISGVLKNAIEWGSRPYEQGAMDGKPMAILGASSGMLGSVRAQFQLRQMAVQVNMHTLNKPQLIIPFAGKKFDEEGNVIDSHTAEKIVKLLEALANWAEKFKK